MQGHSYRNPWQKVYRQTDWDFIDRERQYQ